MGQPSYGSELISRTLAGIGEEASPLTHLSVIESRSAEFAAWPEWVHPAVRDAFAERGLRQPWRHQAEAATLAAEPVEAMCDALVARLAPHAEDDVALLAVRVPSR